MIITTDTKWIDPMPLNMEVSIKNNHADIAPPNRIREYKTESLIISSLAPNRENNGLQKTPSTIEYTVENTNTIRSPGQAAASACCLFPLPRARETDDAIPPPIAPAAIICIRD